MATMKTISGSKMGGASKQATDALKIFNESDPASASVKQIDSAPTEGKNIPIVLGAVRLTGDVIWIKTFLNSKNECRAHVAVCFGRNAFGRPLGLVSVTQGGNYIYRRSGGEVVDPPKAVRFYDGTQTTADPKIVSYEGADKTPAFKGYIYAVLENVKLGDFGAEFTDEFVEQTTQVNETNECDPELDGVDLVYDPSTGKYYGLLNPMSGASSIITSDGCRIIKSVPITSPWRPEYDQNNTIPPGGYKFWADKLYPLHCFGLVVIAGFTVDTFEVSPDPNAWIGFSYSPIFDPNTGRMIFKNVNRTDYGSVPWNTLGRASIWYTSSPASSDIDWKVSYPLPGEPGRLAMLRIFDPDDNIAEDEGFVIELAAEDRVAVLGSGNIACIAVDVPAGRPLSYWLDDMARSQTDPDNPFKLPTDAWNVRGCPVVNEFMYCQSSSSAATLAGIVNGNDEFTVYIWEHSRTGIEIKQTVNVNLPTDWSANGLNFDPETETILVGAAPDSNSLLSGRVYKISLGGSVSYSVLSDGYNRLIGKPNGVAAGGSAPVQNYNASKVGRLDLATDEVETLYDGTAPSSSPVVDLNRNTVSIPSIEGVTTYTATQIEPGEILLVSVLTDCCEIAGVGSEELEFQNLSTSTLRGLLINATIRMSDLFNRLGALYGFTFVETDGKLKFLKKRSGGSLLVDRYLVDEDLALDDQADAAVRVIERSGANNLLFGLDVEYMDPARNFENTTIKIRRPNATFDTGASTRIETLSVPITLTRDEANTLMYEAFYALLQRETRSSFGVPAWHADIEPGDCISVTVDGVEIIGSVTRVTLREDFLQEIEIESYLQDGSTDLSPSEGGGSPSTPPASQVFGEYIHLDIPYLSAADSFGPTSIVQYGGLTAPDITGWSGADLYRSSNGTDFTKVYEYGVGPMAVGTAVNALSQPALRFATDEDNVLIIDVQRGDPAAFVSQTYLAQMNGTLIAAYGRPGAWEIISWQEVSENSDGTLSLSKLQRGLYGSHMIYESTETYGEGNVHVAGDYVCILDPARVIKLQRAFSSIDANELYGVVTSSVSLAAAVKTWNKLSGRSNFIPPVSNFRAVHVSGSSSMTISWDAASQFAGGWPDNGAVNAPMEPVTYVVRIYGWSDTYYISTTDTSIVWADYGTDSDPDAVAEEYDYYLEIFQYSASFPYVGSIESISTYLTPVDFCLGVDG